MFKPKVAETPGPAIATPTTESTQPASLVRHTALPAAGQMLISLQHQLGNRYVQHLVAQTRQAPATPSGPLPVQTKLVLGPVRDKYEQEADHIAQEIVFRSGQSSTPTATPQLSLPQGETGTDNNVTPEIETAIRQAQGSGQALPKPIQSSMGQALGTNFSRVRVHTDSRADNLNHTLAARAFTTGQDIFFRRGEYNPNSRSGQSLLTHELTHVVQQGENKFSNDLQRTGDRVKEPADGAAYTVQQLEPLKIWIENVSALIKAGDYLTAYTMLIDKSMAARYQTHLTLYGQEPLGFSPTKKGFFPLVTPLEWAKKNQFIGNYSTKGEGIINIYFVRDAAKRFANKEGDSEIVLLMALEEYMHMYQARANEFFSAHTKAFKATGQVADLAVTKTAGAGDYDEIDVFAQLIDWGFDVDKLKYVDAYKERQDFFTWYGKSKKTP